MKARALGDIPLLDAVVAFKRKFYRCNWAHYERATASAISLMPPEHARTALYQRSDLLFRQKDEGDMPQRLGAVRSVISRSRPTQ